VAVSVPSELGELLARWRVDVAGRRATDVAGALGVARSAISNWESARRSPSATTLADLDRVFAAGGALVDLATALHSPQALPPRTIWWHNFVPSGGPVWAWIRPATPGLRTIITARWGVLGVRLEHQLHHQGLAITVPVSVSNPPARIEVDHPAWVDFGHGQIPDALGIPTVAAATALRHMAPGGDPTLQIFAAQLRPLIHSPWLAHIRDLLGLGHDTTENTPADPTPVAPTEASMAPGLHLGTSDPWRSLCQEPETWSGAAYRRLRRARRLSRADVASRATVLEPEEPVSDDQILLLESGGHPRVPYLYARLDTIYGADGHTCTDTVAVTHDDGQAIVAFPWWWTGPIWITITSPTPRTPVPVTLIWPPWRQQLQIDSLCTVTTRKPPGPTPPLVVNTPPDVVITGGVGYHPDAHDVNMAWHAIDRHYADSIFNQYFPLYLHLTGQTLTELRHQLDLHTKRAGHP